jgi:hypothetical protein
MHGTNIQLLGKCIYKPCISWRKEKFPYFHKEPKPECLFRPFVRWHYEIQATKQRFQNANTKPTGKQLPTFRTIAERICWRLRTRQTPNINALQAFETPVTVCHSTWRNIQEYLHFTITALVLWNLSICGQSPQQHNPSIPLVFLSSPELIWISMLIRLGSQTRETFCSPITRTLFPYFHNHASQHTYTV